MFDVETYARAFLSVSDVAKFIAETRSHHKLRHFGLNNHLRFNKFTSHEFKRVSFEEQALRLKKFAVAGKKNES